MTPTFANYFVSNSITAQFRQTNIVDDGQTRYYDKQRPVAEFLRGSSVKGANIQIGNENDQAAIYAVSNLISFYLENSTSTNGEPDVLMGGYHLNEDVDNQATMKLGSYYLWIDATGVLRIKNSEPTSDTDGTIVGTQS
jgi:hypothetical protein